ncbi:hypothetical protein EYC98_20780 [Halieaceae bacterium IMCC14734]|uniref:Sulfotransferase family protein n=1 Tax=Candidatus Litorirhabdus singularis TaxID=2518993 RepID=A0ABT3TLU5_9GAMM|nr:hypothetical protein [Candidatus Litorirhabdus singularis]MCX2983304.1 hypothetical protein [Candidatus Litorirhabdus singularis]
MIELEEHNFIVYQFGKVASTSIVNSLNRLPDVAAHQCHFLGVKNFQNAVGTLSNPGLDDYFYEHLEGQLTHNLRLNRLAVRFKAGLVAQRQLHFVSIARNPVDYARSALLQDIEGFINNFVTVWGRGDLPEEEFVIESVQKLLELYIEFLESADVAGMQNMAPVPKFLEARGYREETLRSLSQMVQLMHRPLVWFENQLCDYLDVGLEEIALNSTGILYKDLGWSDVYLFKYEELEKGVRKVVADLGHSGNFAFSRDNESGKKKYSQILSQCFSEDYSDQIQALQRASSYCKAFGY